MIGRDSRDLFRPEELPLVLAEHDAIRRRQKPTTVTRWNNLSVGWRKAVVTRAPLDAELIIGIAQDVTEQGPLNHWLLSVDMENGKLPLGKRYREQSLTWAE